MPRHSVPPPALASVCVIALVAMLVACQPGSDSSSSAPSSPMTATTADETASITGTAVYRERFMPAPGTRLEVQLVDSLLADTPRAVIAETTVENAGASPIPFVLEYDPAQVRDNGMYGLHASLIDPEGNPMLVTDTRHAVTPGADAPVELLLVSAVAKLPAPVSGIPPTRSHWQCDELRVDASYDPQIGAMTLSYSGRNLVLPESVTASGERYADENGNEFRRKGESAILTLSGRPQVECTPTDTPSPWTEAAERGISFRAMGNEPGWWIEVGGGQSPAIKAVLDYGERVIDVANARSDGNGYSGIGADGTPLTLSIERQPCADGMSGERLDASARLRVGEQTYRGCGAFLQD